MCIAGYFLKVSFKFYCQFIFIVTNCDHEAINLLVRFVVTPVSLDLKLSFQDPLASTDLNDKTDRENDPTPDKSKLQNG